jgi:hypothetical protein
MTKVEERTRARALRRQGLSFSEIQAIVAVSKGTLNRWLKEIELTPEQKQRLLDRTVTGREKARMRGAWRNREKRRQRMAAAFDQARREFPERILDPLFMTGVVLYWAEGSKTAPPFMFINSDPVAIRTMIEWLTCVGVPKEKTVANVYVHRVYADCGFERFWETVTELPPSQFRSPVFKKTPHTTKKNPSYMGCCRLVVGSSEFFWKVRAWQEELVKHLGISLPDGLH